MEPTEVQSADDILAAADSRLNAPVEPTIEPATKKGARSETPPPADSETAPANEETETTDEQSFEVDGESLTPTQIREMKQVAARVKDADKAREAAEYLLQHPEEYKRVRRQRGLASQPEPEREAPPQNTGPDPVEDARGWKYERFNQYVDWLQQNGRTATPAQITAQVEQDLVAARTERMHEVLLEERKERAAEKESNAKAQAQWRQEQESAQIARTLTPLFKQYPEAATTAGQEEVEARIIRCVHMGLPVDYEKIVRTVHERSIGAVREWAGKKRAMSAATGPASGRGGSAQGTKTKLVDSLPADVSSITEYAERASRGEH